MSTDPEVLKRLTQIEERLAKIETLLTDAAQLREEVALRDARIDGLAKQGMRVVDMLDSARREIERLKQG